MRRDLKRKRRSVSKHHWCWYKPTRQKVHFIHTAIGCSTFIQKWIAQGDTNCQMKFHSASFFFTWYTASEVKSFEGTKFNQNACQHKWKPMVTLFVLRVAVYSSSFIQLLQHLFQLLGSEFWVGNFAILYVFCIAWNYFFDDRFAQPFPKLRIWDLP